MNDSLKLNEFPLQHEAVKIFPILQNVLEKFVNEKISSYDFVGIFILCYLSVRRPNGWSNGRLRQTIVSSMTETDKNITISSEKLSNITGLLDLLCLQYLERKLKYKDVDSLCVSDLTVLDIFDRLQLTGIKQNKDNYVNHSIILWSLGLRPFQLLFYIPSPMEVLRQQASGKRVITMFLTESELSIKHTAMLYYMDGTFNHSKDAFEFLLHDMKHMEHFMDKNSHLEQVGFCRCMLKLSNGKPRNFFLHDCGLDDQLWRELEYVISDMNCFAPHLMSYLFAKVAAAVGRRVGDASDGRLREAIEGTWDRVLAAFASPDLCSGDVEEAAVAGRALVQIHFRERTGLTAAEGEQMRDFFIGQAASSRP